MNQDKKDKGNCRLLRVHKYAILSHWLSNIIAAKAFHHFMGLFFKSKTVLLYESYKKHFILSLNSERNFSIKA